MSRGVVKPCTPTLQCAEDSQSITSYVLPHNHSYYLTAVYQVNIRTTTQAEYNQLHLFTHTVTSSRAGDSHHVGQGGRRVVTREERFRYFRQMQWALPIPLTLPTIHCKINMFLKAHPQWMAS